MKFIANIAADLFIGWPAFVLGYLYKAAKSSFSAGARTYREHEGELMAKWSGS
jgi:hypothetical protein